MKKLTTINHTISIGGNEEGSKTDSLQNGVVENVQGGFCQISKFPKLFTVKSQSMYAVTAVCVVSRTIHQ